MRSRIVRFALVALLVLRANDMHSQDRMPPIAADKMTEAQRKAAEDFAAERKTPVSGPFVPLLRSPDLMIRAHRMGEYLRFRSALPARLSEFVILITARRWTQQFEWYQHQPIAFQAGLKADIIKAVEEGRRPEQMAEDEEIVYTLCDELERTRNVGDATYTRAVATLGENGVIDTLGLAGYYTLLAMVLNTARTPLPDGAKPPLAPLSR